MLTKLKVKNTEKCKISNDKYKEMDWQLLFISFYYTYYTPTSFNEARLKLKLLTAMKI